MMLLVIGLCFCIHWKEVSTTMLPSTKCKISDSECLKTVAGQFLPSFVQGDEELGIPVLDPLSVSKIDVNAIGMTLHMTDTKFKGFGNSVFEDVLVNEKKKNIKLTFVTDQNITAKYKASGRLVVLPISGDGDYDLQIKKNRVHITLKYEDKEMNGKHFMELSDYKYSFQIMGSLKLHLTNLFDGNKFLSDNIHNFVNANWRSIEQEVGRPTINPAIQVIYEALRTLFRSKPREEFFEN